MNARWNFFYCLRSPNGKVIFFSRLPHTFYFRTVTIYSCSSIALLQRSTQGDKHCIVTMENSARPTPRPTHGSMPGLTVSILLFRCRSSFEGSLSKANTPFHRRGSAPLQPHTRVSGSTVRCHQRQKDVHILEQKSHSTKLCTLLIPLMQSCTKDTTHKKTQKDRGLVIKSQTGMLATWRKGVNLCPKTNNAIIPFYLPLLDVTVVCKAAWQSTSRANARAIVSGVKSPLWGQLCSWINGPLIAGCILQSEARGLPLIEPKGLNSSIFAQRWSITLIWSKKPAALYFNSYITHVGENAKTMDSLIFTELQV